MDTAPALSALAEAVDRIAAGDRFAGLVVRVTRDGDAVYESARGCANRAWQAPCTMETRFDIASVTKLFTAVAVLQQVERGGFGLDTSVVDYLSLTGTTISPAVTPYHLLTHTSGIADDADEEAGERYEDLFRDTPTYAFTETADQLPHFVTKPPNFAPGQGCRYCNGGYLLLGLMVERATGQQYRDYVAEHVFAPAGMTRSGFFRMDVVEPDVAEAVEPILDGERVTGWRRNIFAYPPVGDPAGGAYATVGDLLAFDAALVEGRLLGPALTEAALSPKEVHTRLPRRTWMNGFGLLFSTDLDGHLLTRGKEGVNVGVSGLLRDYPRHRLTLAILGIGEDTVWDPVNALEHALPGVRD